MTTERSIPRIVVTGLVVAIAAPIAINLWDHYEEAPWTRDGHVRADVVAVASDVSSWSKRF
ncbi:hypothetical protein [Bradyrhizobium zhanjiangense]|uniref:hypothetical protein n=1 Tax=Bradyrhizobium zhanjiangense TaxID=1325107 RepID=UPI001FDFF9F7|nr:hypothetical protein [Bradyrhizobium zhanjiangense]